MKTVKLFQLWKEFSKTTINNKDCIEVGFFCWKKGTYRFVILVLV